MTFRISSIVGADISKYQDDPKTPEVVDFQQMKDYGFSFVVMRVGQGNFIDREWHKHRLNSRGILPRAAYWFFDPYYPPELQADLCLIALGNERLEGRLWLDLEFWWGGSYTAPRHWKHFLDIIKSAGIRTGIYTSKSWWDAHAAGADMSYFGKEESWIAQYYTALTRVPAGFREPMLWQSGTPAIGLAAGVESLEIDFNHWNGNYSFEDEWGTSSTGGEVILPQEGNAIMDKWKVTWLQGCNTRPEPNVNNTYIATLPTGYEFDSSTYFVPTGKTPEQERWAQLESGYWVALVYSSAPRCALVTPAPTPEPASEIVADITAEVVVTVDGIQYQATAAFTGLRMGRVG